MMKDGVTQDKISGDGGVIYFEMKVAELMDKRLCLVVRGISSHVDSHKNKIWH
jgi:hypothetical protein